MFVDSASRLFSSFGQPPLPAASIIHFMIPSILGLLGIHVRFTYLFGFWASMDLDEPEVTNFTRKPSSISFIPLNPYPLICISSLRSHVYPYPLAFIPVSVFLFSICPPCSILCSMCNCVLAALSLHNRCILMSTISHIQHIYCSSTPLYGKLYKQQMEQIRQRCLAMYHTARRER